MTWTTWPPTAPGGPSAKQGGWDGFGPVGGAYPTKWTAQRSMLGLVQMRLTDVSIVEANPDFPGSGQHWDSPTTLRTRLLDASGNPLTNWADVKKTWAVPGSWYNLGVIPSPKRAVRLETAAIVKLQGSQVRQVSWTAELRCDNYGGTA